MIDDLPLSGTRFGVEYDIAGPERDARATADLIAIDQTVEAPDAIVPPPIRESLVGRVEECRQTGDRYRVVVTFPVELLGDDCTRLLLVLFGISSLRSGIRVVGLQLPTEALAGWPGPRFGRHGLRQRLNIQGRPLVCAVLKPLGLSVRALADLAYHFALGGIDLIKDDQALADQPFSPFEERVLRCAEAIDKATHETGRRCLYAPHVTASWEILRGRAVLAQRAGAGALLVCPGLAGFDALLSLARDPHLTLPLLSHPALLGSFYVNAASGMAPRVLFGQLPRLVGADVSIYPAFGVDFPISRQDCLEIAEVAGMPWGGIQTMFPTAAGRMGVERVDEMRACYGDDVVFILGSRVQSDPQGVVEACRAFMRRVAGDHD